MMRMFAWVNLLQTGRLREPRPDRSSASSASRGSWLNGKPSTVIFGLIYGYVPFMILPLYGTLDRIDRSTLEASRDLGARPGRGRSPA